MRITFFDWESAKSLLQRWFGYFQPECVTIINAAPVQGNIFPVAHSLPTNLVPNSASGTVMSGGFVYYYEADKQLWTANTANQQGFVYVRASVANALCEIRVRQYDDVPAAGRATGTAATGTTGLIGAGSGGTGVDSSLSTGIARVSAGAWSFNAGIQHLGASTSADLRGVLSDETGTGPAVFATSPTLTTPIIGDLTNATHGHTSNATGGTLSAAAIASGQLAAARGGTALDTSGSTGVPRIAAGTWSANAGISHLAASSSSDLRGVLSDETGTGSAVFADSASMTGLNVSDGALSVKSMLLQAFVLELTNTAGVIQHRIFANAATAAAGNFSSKISGASATLANTPSVNNVTNFTSGAGIDAGGTQRFVFNTAAQTDADCALIAVVEFNSTATNITAQLRNDNINVNGTTRNWLGVAFFVNASGANFNITTANIAAGQIIRVRFVGFVA